MMNTKAIKICLFPICFLTNSSNGQTTINNEWLYLGRVGDQYQTYTSQYEFLRTINIARDSTSTVVSIIDSVTRGWGCTGVFRYFNFNTEQPCSKWLPTDPKFSDIFNYSYSNDSVNGRIKYNNSELNYSNTYGRISPKGWYNSIYIHGIGLASYERETQYLWSVTTRYTTSYSLIKFNGIAIDLGGATNIIKPKSLTKASKNSLICKIRSMVTGKSGSS